MRTRLEYKPNITEEIESICEKYWLRADNRKNEFTYTCKEIAIAFNLKSVDITKVSKDNSCLIVSDCHCESCGVTNICRIRSDLIQLNLNNWTCNECEALTQQRIREDLSAEAERHRQEKIEAQETLTNALKDYRSVQIQSIPSVENISVIEHILLVAVVESMGSDDLQSTLSLRNNLQVMLSPSYRIDTEILKRLYRKNLLLIDTENSYHCVEMVSKDNFEIDFFQMNFDFAYDNKQLYQLIADSKSEAFKYSLVENPEYKEWCQRIQIEECIKYLDKRAKMNNLLPAIGEKMENLLSICLLKYSVSETYYMIWGAVESASAYFNKVNITRLHASNSIYGNIQRTYDKLVNRTIQNRQYNRDGKHPQSVIEKLLFDRIYEVENCGFTCTIDKLLNRFKLQMAPSKQPYSAISNIENASYSVVIKISK